MVVVVVALVFAGAGGGEVGQGEHREGDVGVPGPPGADLVVVQAGFVLRGLEALLDRPPRPLKDGGCGAVIATSRRWWIWCGVIAHVRAGLLVAAAALTLSACGAQAPAAPATPTAPPPAPAVAPTGGDVDHPVIGVAYPFELFTHCGIRTAEFGGRSWAAVHPTDQPHPGGHDTTAGTMTLVSGDAARFDYAGSTAEFVPVIPPTAGNWPCM